MLASMALAAVATVGAPLVDYATLFAGREACFELVDARTGAMVASFGGDRRTRRFTPCSTFKVPLALMAFEHGLADEHTVFRWDGRKHDFASWNADQTPRTWLERSVVWVSQELTPRLGRPLMHRELAAFGFGNADVSGDITGFWLTTQGRSSLGVSADEQVRFWRRLWDGTLPLPTSVQARVRAILPRETGRNGAVLAGKTGSGYMAGPTGAVDRHRQLGWYVGVLQSGGRAYVVACNTSDRQPDATKGPAGLAGRAVCERILGALGLF